MKNFDYHQECSDSSNQMEFDSLSDEFLLFLSCNGNIDAFNCITERYKNSLMNYVFYSIFDYRKSQDIVQETFIRLFQKQKTTKGNFLVSTMVFSIARNLVRKHVMWKKWESLLGNSRSNAPVETPFKSAVHQALLSLNISSREVIILRDIEGMSFDEIATITRKSVSNTKSRVSEARRKLQGYVDTKPLQNDQTLQVVLQPLE